jgi:hypothetical protein
MQCSGGKFENSKVTNESHTAASLIGGSNSAYGTI